MITRAWVVVCDDCGNMFAHARWKKFPASVVQAARDAGWARVAHPRRWMVRLGFGHDYHICPRCVRS